MKAEIKNKEFSAIEIVRWPCVFEAGIECVLQLLGLCVVYWLFNTIGISIIGENFSPDVLLSMVVLPAIYILKDSFWILYPLSVSVALENDTVAVKSGIFTVIEDSLKLSTVENIETVTSLFGRFLNYGTLRVYSYGSWGEVPYVRNVTHLKIRIENKSSG